MTDTSSTYEDDVTWIEKSGCSDIQSAWEANKEFVESGGEEDTTAVHILAEFVTTSPPDTLASPKI